MGAIGTIFLVGVVSALVIGAIGNTKAGETGCAITIGILYIFVFGILVCFLGVLGYGCVSIILH